MHQIIIDGYNLLFQSGFNARDLDEGRTLVDAISEMLNGFKEVPYKLKKKMIFVFDGNQIASENPKKQRLLGFRLIFTVPGKSADQKIVEMVRKSDNPKGIFVVSDDKASLEELEFNLDLLLCTASGKINWEPLLNTLKKKAVFILVGFQDLELNSTDLVAHQLSITGSFIGSRATMQEMFSFAQSHGIKPAIETMPMSKVNEALQRVKENKARYRIVLVNNIY